MGGTVDKGDSKRYKAYLNAELEAAAMYRAMAEAEKDPRRSEVFERLVQAELRHAARWAEKLGMDSSRVKPANEFFKVRLYRLAARLLGTEKIVPWLVRAEAGDIEKYAVDPEARDLVAEERRHARVLREMTNGGGPLAAIRSERGQTFGDGGSLRAAVLGVNDGLVSNFSLVMGVAGGTSNSDFVLLAGIAGLLAGAFSMAAGEYISMRSQRDVYEYRIQMEQEEIEEWPEEEHEELVLIYQAKGFSETEAEEIADQIMTQPQVALETMAREELGLDPEQLGSPWGASFSSFVAFVGGAIVPIIPYIAGVGGLAFGLSAGLSAGALILVGGWLAGMSGKSVSWGSMRMLLAGGAAAATTFGIGRLIGTTIVG